MIKREKIDFGKAPASVVRNIKELKKIKKVVDKIKKESKNKIMEKYDTEKYLVIVFKSREEKNALLKKLGLPENERYIAASSLDIRLAKGKTIVLGENKASPMSKSGATG
ncbi:MAG: hypothetical protein QXQ37_00665 [Nitrososphaerota archaeon]